MQQHPVDHDISPPDASTELIQNLNRPASDKNNLSLNVNKNDTLTENENNNNNENSLENTSLPPKQSEKENDNNNKNNIIDILNNYCILSKTNNSELPTLAPRPPPLPIEVIKSISEEDIKNFNKLFDANQLPLPNVTSLSQIDHNQIEALTQFYLAAITANRNKTNGQSSDNQANTVTAEMIKREILNHKVRADNRERKKRWREQNEERNKDNDLRCRVNKRALKLFGKEQSEVKQLWIENEFNRRQYKRKEKERRKYAVNNVVSANHSKSNGNMTSTSNSSSSSSSSPHSSAGHLPILQDAYLSMVLNNLETMSPASAFKFVEGMRLMESTIKNGTENEQSLSHQVADFLQQLQQYQPTEQDISEKLGKSDLQVTESTSNKDHDPSTQANSPIAEPILSFLSSSVSSPSLSSVSSSLSPSPPESINTSIEHAKANIDNIYNPVSSTSISSNQHSNASLSTLLISTLQQAAVIDSNMEQENLLSSISPTVADDMNNTIPQHPNQLYPMEQIMTLMKLNTQWKLM